METVYRILLSIFSFIPYKRKGITSKVFTFVLASLVSYRKKVILTNLTSSFPEFDSNKIQTISNAYYSVLVTYLFETIQVYSKPKDFFHNKITFTNPEILDTLPEKSNIIIGSHYGNWEWAAMLQPLYTERKIVALYKPLSNKVLDKIVKEKRARFGLELLSMEEAVRKISKATESKSYIFVSDQSPAQATTGQWRNFLHQPTLFYEGAVVLAKRYGLKVFYQHVECKDEKYIVTYLPLDDTNIIDQYVLLLESQIKQMPEWWLWSHRRWKHQKKV